MSTITGGCILLEREILDSELWCSKPKWWFSVWAYILLRVNFADKGLFKRGQNFFNVDEIHRNCYLSIEGIKPESIHNVIKWLRSEGKISTKKSTRGMIITVCDYDYYQNIENYRNRESNHIQNKQKTFKNKKLSNCIDDSCANIKNNNIVSENPREIIQKPKGNHTIKEKSDNVKTKNKKNTNKSTAKDVDISIDEIFDHYEQTFKTKLRVRGDTRRAMLKERLQTFSLDELKQVAINISKSPFHMGENNEGRKYNNFEALYRDDVQVEKYLNMNAEDPYESLIIKYSDSKPELKPSLPVDQLE